MIGLPGAAEGRPGDDFSCQEFVRDLIDAEIDRSGIGADIVGKPRFQGSIVGEPCRVRRIFQRLLPHCRAVDAEYAHQISRLPAELGFLAGRKAHDLRVELKLLEGQRGLLERPAAQPAGIDRSSSCGVQRPAAPAQPPSASGATRYMALKLNGRREASCLPFFLNEYARR